MYVLDIIIKRTLRIVVVWRLIAKILILFDTFYISI